MKDPFFFGYGSLVNRRTHDYLHASTASVRGWRRAWRHTPLRDVSFLTVVPAAEDYIDGLIAAVPGADWAALDERERAYDRHDATPHVSHDIDRQLDVAIYAIPDGFHRTPDADNPVLLSYLDTVVQGFLNEFGPEGAQHFFETTEGWHAPILDDRAAPIYPRAQVLSAEERDVVDDGLGRLSAVVKQLD
ncbi:gamma-glutamylcyclotransferase [Aliiroseovarius subalbicans]|uniref:gamma-glutamylcyclotransferase n=1 Tax=Aliiroseovarius subalbicans TaxID=2925840 RepID=UPI001F5A22C3|nr:gamma-glutamylcyclotransferase [Aliiroseovarius subalbicans]MCI2399361.1 gamma-glutamylcyclotransferase [Aliiroseovarius subalbicans]